jgi:hypothetical protein
MSSRDFSFLSLRPPLAAYQANGLPVPPNTVLITSSTGAAIFSNTVNVSTINVSTLNGNYISSNIIYSNTIDVSTVNASSIDTQYLEANKALISSSSNDTWDNATLTVNNTISIVGNTPAASQLLLHNGKSRLGTSDPYAGLFLQASTPQSIYFSNIDDTTSPYAAIGPGSSGFNGTMTVASSLTCSTLNTNAISTNFISSNVINVNDLLVNSTIYLTNLPSGSPLELTWNTSQLFIDGHVVATDGTISSISTLYWEPNTIAGDGNIVNKSKGAGTNKYLVGIGYDKTSTINATLDVIYTGTAYGNVFNASTTNGQRLTMDTNGILSLTSSLNVNGRAGIGTSTPQDTLDVNGSILLTSSNVTLSRFTTQFGDSYIQAANTLRFTTIGATSTTMVVLPNPNPRVGINTTNPTTTLDVAGNTRTGLDTVSTTQFTLYNTNPTTASTVDITTEFIMSTSAGYYKWYLTNDIDQGGSGGLSKDHLQLFTNIGGINEIMDISPNGNVRFPDGITTNTISMTNGTINPGGSPLTLGGPLYVSSFGNDIASANLKLFNGKGSIVTNTGFDGIYIESGDNRPIILCSTLDTKEYARFGPSTNILNTSTIINNRFSVVYNDEISLLSSNNGNYLYVNAKNSGFVNLGAFNSTIGSRPLCLQLESGGVAGGNVGIGISSPQTTLDVAGNTRIGLATVSTTTLTLYNTNSTTSGLADITTEFIMSTSAGYYKWYLTNSTATSGSGGLTKDHLQLFGYIGGTNEIIDISPNGDVRFPDGITTNTISMTNGQISNVSTINGLPYDSGNDIYWVSTNTNDITNDNPGSVIIRSTLSTNYGIVNQNSGIRLIDGFGNSVNRPTLTATSTLSSFVIHGANATPTNDDGFLQLSAGGGSSTGTISFIQLSGYSGVPDMDQNIVFGTAGTQRMRIDNAGNVGIGTSTPQVTLDVAGPAISRVATSTITGDPGDSYSNWAPYIGKYCFVNGVNLTLPITSPPANFDGSIVVIRNISGGTTIGVTNSNGGGSILPGKTTSYVYTNSVTAGWYAL